MPLLLIWECLKPVTTGYGAATKTANVVLHDVLGMARKGTCQIYLPRCVTDGVHSWADDMEKIDITPIIEMLVFHFCITCKSVRMAQ